LWRYVASQEGEETTMSGPRIPPEHRDELADLFKRHSNSIHRRAYVLSQGDGALAEDLVQDAFIAVFRDWSKLRTWDEASLLARLRTIVANKAIDEFRHNEVHRRSLPRLCPDPPPSAEDEAIGHAEVGRAWLIMRQLPVMDYMVAVLRWECGMLQREIADRLQMAEGTVATTLRRVRGVIAEALQDGTGEVGR
jgi:RNA polymerase sigma factor (sigma-70 family)